MLAILIALVPQGPVTSERIDILELNHYYDANGRHVFDQIIGWRWDGERHRVEWWSMWTDKPKPTGKTLVFKSGDRLRRIRYNELRESWTQVDPELADRAVFPKCKRRGLVK